jgi:hypothetical protein
MMRAGVAAEFADEDALLTAVRALRARGLRALDAFTPHPVHGLDDALGLGRSRLNWLIFPFGMGGAGFAFFLQWWCNAYDYRINVGGRDPFAIPAFIPITFEVGVLTSGVLAFFGLCWMLGLPRLTNPVFRLDGFERASVDRYWLAIDVAETHGDPAPLSGVLRELGALRVESFGGEAS